MDRASFIRGSIDDTFRLWLRRSAFWGSALFLLLGGIDLLVAPGHASRFLVYRAAIAAALLGAAVLAQRLPPRHLPALGFGMIAASATVIELMIVQFHGRSSPYAAGMVLLGVAAMGFLPGRFPFHLAAALAVYLIYLVPLVVLSPANGGNDFLVSNVFMILIFSTMLLTRYVSSRTLVEDLGLRYDLERYRQGLEDAVAERTAELAGAIEDLQKEIAERKRAEEDRSRLQGQFLQAQKMESVGRLAGGVAHDFNNILTAIMSYAELCIMTLPEDHPVLPHVTAIRDASEKAAQLTHRLLAFSRKQVLDMRPLDLNSVVEGMAAMLRRMIGEDVVLEIRPGIGIEPVRADKGQVEQILMNLAVNARDAMPEGGRLVIGTEAVAPGDLPPALGGALKGRGYVLLTAKDTGKGMSADVQDRLFEPFFTTKDPGKGAGLGLATVYGIVKQHEGHIMVQSGQGKGTTFRVYLPIAAHARSDQPGARSAMPRGTETVLVVEDDEAIRNLIRDILGPLGYRVLATASGEEALERYGNAAGPIQLLLTDVIMPGMNGKVLAERMKAARPEIKVLFMSGYAHDALSDQGLLGSGASLIHKPLGPVFLAAQIRRVLDGAE